MEENGREQNIRQLLLMAVSRCSECLRDYQLTDFAVIGHRDHLWMVTVICKGCRSQGFITAIVEEVGAERPGATPLSAPTISDLLPTEEQRAGAPSVTSHDLLDLHDFLREFDGNFAGLFQQRDGRG